MVTKLQDLWKVNKQRIGIVRETRGIKKYFGKIFEYHANIVEIAIETDKQVALVNF